MVGLEIGVWWWNPIFIWIWHNPLITGIIKILAGIIIFINITKTKNKTISIITSVVLSTVIILITLIQLFRPIGI